MQRTGNLEVDGIRINYLAFPETSSGQTGNTCCNNAVNSVTQKWRLCFDGIQDEGVGAWIQQGLIAISIRPVISRIGIPGSGNNLTYGKAIGSRWTGVIALIISQPVLRMDELTGNFERKTV